MSGMNEFLAQYYGTGGASAETDMNEDLHKQASIELFAKLADSQNIDLASLSDEQVEELYADFQKQASDDKDEDDKAPKAEKKEEAKKELEEKKAAAEKVAEADYLGRVMAHSYIDELQKIAADKEAGLGDSARRAGSVLKDKMKSVADIATGKELREGLTARKNTNSQLGQDMLRRASNRGGVSEHERAQFAKGMTSAANEAATKKIRSGAAKTVGLYGGAAAATGGGAMLASGKKKEASALEELAVESALLKAASGGYDVDEASERLGAVLTLGLPEEKTAGVTDVDLAVDIRSLELLEAAGYPVTWPQ